MSTEQTLADVLARSSAQTLNQGTFCRTLNLEVLRQQLESVPSLKGLMQDISATRPHLFSSTVVFLSGNMARQITQMVAAIERIVALPGYRAQALARAPAIAQHAFGPTGACMGFDFHLSEAGPQLIEVNTNAGGALLNVALARAQRSCCEAMNWAFPPERQADTLEQTLFDMFLAEIGRAHV